MGFLFRIFLTDNEDILSGLSCLCRWTCSVFGIRFLPARRVWMTREKWLKATIRLSPFTIVSLITSTFIYINIKQVLRVGKEWFRSIGFSSAHCWIYHGWPVKASVSFCSLSSLLKIKQVMKAACVSRRDFATVAFSRQLASTFVIF